MSITVGEICAGYGGVVGLDYRTGTVHICLVYTDRDGAQAGSALCERGDDPGEWYGDVVEGTVVDRIARYRRGYRSRPVCATCLARWVTHQQDRPSLPTVPLLTGRWFTRHIGRVTAVVDLSAGDDPYLMVEGACHWVARITTGCSDRITLSAYHAGRLQRWKGTTDGVDGRVCPDCLAAEVARTPDVPETPSLLDLLEVVE